MLDVSLAVFALGIAATIVGVVANVRSVVTTKRPWRTALRVQVAGIGVSLIGFALLAISVIPRAGLAAVVLGTVFGVCGIAALALSLRVEVRS